MRKFFVIMMPANVIGKAQDAFYCRVVCGAMTDDLKAATQFETQMDALHCRNQLASAWRCCAQVRAVEVVPPVAEQLKLCAPGQV